MKKCTKCGVSKVLTDFQDKKTKTKKGITLGKASWCIACTNLIHEQGRRYHKVVNQNRVLDVSPRHCSGCNEVKDISCFPKSLSTISGYSYHCRECRAVIQKKCEDKIRDFVYKYYGSVCKCCGESEKVFLSIDHEGNDGSKHKHPKGYKYSGNVLLRWLIKNNFPEGFRLLCMNCNFGRYRNGNVCPHKALRIVG